MFRSSSQLEDRIEYLEQQVRILTQEVDRLQDGGKKTSMFAFTAPLVGTSDSNRPFKPAIITAKLVIEGFTDR